jgi:stearoyl-CoA desaturase (delta-9 desaturase)
LLLPRPTRSRPEILGSTAFLLALHAIPVVALFAGTTQADWLALVAFYLWGAFGMGIGLHRYFAHAAFDTSRAFQFFLALSAASTFTDPIAFAGKHRLHHKYSDTEEDVHSPGLGWWFCWFGHYVDEGYPQEEVDAMARDLARYPEMRWLRRYFLVPGGVIAALTWLLGGFSMFAIGFCLSRVLIIHASSAVNYFCHRLGTRRYATRDLSTNNIFVALLTFGEGWHNNHHHYPAAARAGFYWWEVDAFYYLIRLLAAAGIVWNVREVPVSVRQTAGLSFRPLAD